MRQLKNLCMETNEIYVMMTAHTKHLIFVQAVDINVWTLKGNMTQTWTEKKHTIQCEYFLTIIMGFVSRHQIFVHFKCILKAAFVFFMWLKEPLWLLSHCFGFMAQNLFVLVVYSEQAVTNPLNMSNSRETKLEIS